MTLDDAVAAVEATIDPAVLRVDRRRAREDAASFLLLVLDVSGAHHGDRPVANGPRLVHKRTGEVSRITVTDALARAGWMELVAH